MHPTQKVEQTFGVHIIASSARRPMDGFTPSLQTMK